MAPWDDNVGRGGLFHDSWEGWGRGGVLDGSGGGVWNVALLAILLIMRPTFHDLRFLFRIL